MGEQNLDYLSMEDIRISMIIFAYTNKFIFKKNSFLLSCLSRRWRQNLDLNEPCIELREMYVGNNGFERDNVLSGCRL